jgi:hypothetical protein
MVGYHGLVNLAPFDGKFWQIKNGGELEWIIHAHEKLFRCRHVPKLALDYVKGMHTLDIACVKS